MKKELGRVSRAFGGTAEVWIKLVRLAALALVLCLGLSFRVMAQEISAGKNAVSTLRVARPTDDLPEVIKFHRDGLGLEVLASFSGHNDKSYNPWWDDGGKTFADIDGYRVVLYNRRWDK